MHYYSKNIADFNNATRHLTRQERSIYSDLIELQYDLESPLPEDLDWVCKRILASTETERTDVERMLNEYFDLVEQGWSNARCEEEIRLFIDKRSKAVAAGKASGEARRRNKKPNKNKDSERTLNGCSTDVELTNNHKPITNNHKPIKKNTPSALNFDSWPELPSEQILKDWKAMRRAKKAHISQTVINRYAKQLQLAVDAGYTVDECLSLSTTKCWLDFKFEWFLSQENQNARSSPAGRQDYRTKSEIADDAAREALMQTQ